MSYEVWGEPDEHECSNCDNLIGERDEAQEAADRLAHCIADMLGVDIGEHSNQNDPSKEAGDYADAVNDGRAACGRWQPISMAPKDGTHVLVCDAARPHRPPTVAHWWETNWALSVCRYGEESDHGCETLTHWMPLQAVPQPAGN